MSEHQWSLEEIKAELLEIKEMGFISSERFHDTGIGHTLEQWLDLKENNIALPDFGDLELKTHRIQSNSYITILTKAPSGVKNRDLLERFGYPRESNGKMVLHQMIYLDKQNKRGFTLRYDQESQNLNLYKCGELLGYYSREQLIEKFNEKISDGVILVLAKSRKSETGVEEFHYVEALILKGFDFDEYLKCIYYDIRIGRYPDGRPHDHGSGFRVKKADLENIFQIYEKIM